jgi:hypothetical protein
VFLVENWSYAYFSRTLHQHTLENIMLCWAVSIEQIITKRTTAITFPYPIVTFVSGKVETVFINNPHTSKKKYVEGMMLKSQLVVYSDK